jgi:uncharacterized protein YuzB (UPF0349 family)
MLSLIEFCVNNMHHGTDEVMKKLEEHREFDVIEYGCLGNCGVCAALPYALVNGECVEAESAEELYDKILAKIEEQQREFDLE